MIIDNSAVRELPKFPESKGFSVRLIDEEYIYDVGKKSRLDLTLDDLENAEIFDVMVEDISRYVNVAHDEREAVRSFLGRIVQWQSFLEKLSPKVLSSEQQRGLYGELRCLRDLMAPHIGLDAALRAWIGPSGADKDFEWQSIAVEVKTTVTRKPQTFAVSSERQLDGDYLESLLIFHLSLQRSTQVGESLPAVISDLRAMIDDYSNKILFDQSLLESGYSDDYVEDYDQAKYTVREQHLFLVGPDFPKITEGDLATGVSNVRYNVNIDQCVQFEVSESDIPELLGVDNE